MTPQFHPLRVAQVRPETPDTVSIAFEVPDTLRDAYRFTQGQFLTLKAPVDGKDVRRSYSICCGVQDYAESGELRVAVKLVDDGVFSTKMKWESQVKSMRPASVPASSVQALTGDIDAARAEVDKAAAKAATTK